MRFTCFGFSDTGKIRKQNQDSYLCNEEQKLFLVADGMGGRASGEKASQLAVSSVEAFISGARAGDPDRAIEMGNDLTREQNRMLSAARHANRHIYDVALNNPEMKGMGTTLTGAAVEGDRLVFVHVGDCRLYRIRDTRIEQLTEDHTLVSDEKRKGRLSEQAARKHPNRHTLTSALGIYQNPRIDISDTRIQKGDLYLICSDGLHGVVEDGVLLDIVMTYCNGPLFKLGLSLVLKANLEGGPDNITVVVIAF
jgi:protein phosphatase